MPSTVLVISFDRLPAHALGCYGGVGAQTPQLDRLAAEGVVFDSHYLEDVGTESPRHAWWSGRYEHASPDEPSSPNLFELLIEHDVDVQLITHSHVTTDEDQNPAEDENVAKEVPDLDRRVFDRGLEQLRKWLGTPADRSRLLWLHTPGYADFQKVETWPSVPSAGGFDVELYDTLIQAARDGANVSQEQQELWRQIQRDRVTEIDRQIGLLCDEIRNADHSPVVVVTVARGDVPILSSLVPDCPATLSISHVRVPQIVWGTQKKAAMRRKELTQTVDIAPTLLKMLTDVEPPDHWVGQDLGQLLNTPMANVSDWNCDSIKLGANRKFCFGVRTADYYLAVEGEDDAFVEDIAMLFQLPEDAHGVHNLARQEPSVVEELIEKYREFRTSCEKVGEDLGKESSQT
ncbi:sulfatase-like hydrolase/transferase [Thalassoroseus pseudoceratinae]|uniref:sulfatase-like hydrolase/transferase n=1 Tax=Thalassoroseus pseudoceratinae TaxID=2713176 RepID=UPI00142320F4|nr:sulfatase-like hydrolase/transferase [Thalassoroseus pseudoceratinae]